MPTNQDSVAENTFRLWFCINTPSAFREYNLPIDQVDMTPEDQRRYDELQALAKIHGAGISVSPYRRG